MRKSIKKSLYLCAAALMIGGVVAPSASNSISASAHSRYAISRYSHKKNIHKYNTKQMAHLQRIHRYHVIMEAKDETKLANHKKELRHYNHLLRVHKHNRKMINNLTRSKRKLIKMINNDQRGITRYAKYIDSEEHQISLASQQVKRANASKRKNSRYGGKRYSYWFNLGNRHLSRYAKRHLPAMNYWERRAFTAGVNKYNSNSAMSRSRYNKLFNAGYSAGSNGRKASPYGSKASQRAYNYGYAKGLAEFSQKKAQNRYKYLKSISYLAGYDDGYHNNQSNYNNSIMAKLLKSNSTYMSNYHSGYTAGNKAYVNIQNHTQKNVIPKVIVPNNLNKVVKPKVNNKGKNVKPTVIMPKNLRNITKNHIDGEVVKPALVKNDKGKIVIPKVVNNNGKVVKPKLIYPNGKVVKPTVIYPKNKNQVVIPKVVLPGSNVVKKAEKPIPEILYSTHVHLIGGNNNGKGLEPAWIQHGKIVTPKIAVAKASKK